MNIILFDTYRADLYPLSLTRPISYFRIGILTIKEKWEVYFTSVSVLSEDYLLDRFPVNIQKDNIWVNAKLLPSDDIVTEIKNLRIGESLKKGSWVVVK